MPLPIILSNCVVTPNVNPDLNAVQWWIDCSTGNVDCSLPETLVGRYIRMKRIDSNAATQCTVQTASTDDTIQNLNNLLLQPGQCYGLVCQTSNNWQVIEATSQ
jgi:hypothetical protein